MKTYSIILSIILLTSCKSRVAKKELPDLYSIQDPMLSQVHDSLKHLIPILDSVFYSDQQYRWGMHLQPKEIQDQMIRNMKENETTIKAADAHNVRVVTGILDEYGFLGLKDIGMKGYFAQVFTIQHADKETQKRYLPIFFKAVTERKLMAFHYAMLADRVAIRHNEHQMYGTQIAILKKKVEVLPLLQPDSVDVWRKQLRMEPLSDYVKRFHVTWDLEKYKKELPHLRTKYKITNNSHDFYYRSLSN